MIQLWPHVYVDDSSIVRADFLNFVRTQLVRAIDGFDGGTYNPTSPIIIGGAGLSVTGDFGVGGDLAVGGDVAISGNLDVTGETTLFDSVYVNSTLYAYVGMFVGGPTVFSPSATLTVNAPATFNDTLTVNAPATFNDTLTVNAPATFNDTITIASAPIIDPPITLRRMLSMQASTSNLWYRQPEGRWIYLGATTQVSELVFDLDLPDGGTLIEIGLTINPGNGHAGPPGSPPKLTLYAEAGAFGSLQLGSVTDDTSNLAAYENAHLLIIENINHTIGRNPFNYVLHFQNEFGTNSETRMLVYRLYAKVRVSQASLW